MYGRLRETPARPRERVKLREGDVRGRGDAHGGLAGARGGTQQIDSKVGLAIGMHRGCCFRRAAAGWCCRLHGGGARAIVHKHTGHGELHRQHRRSLAAGRHEHGREALQVVRLDALQVLGRTFVRNHFEPFCGIGGCEARCQSGPDAVGPKRRFGRAIRMVADPPSGCVHK